MTRGRCGLNHIWACLFLWSLFLLVSVSVPWLFFLVQMYAHCIGSRPTRLKVRIHPTLHAHVSSRFEYCSWSLRLLHSLLLLPHHLSDHPAVPTARHLQLPRCRGQIPCVLPLRTLAPWPRTSLPQVMSPTTTSSRRLMSNAPRSPRANSGSLVTLSTMTPPSARRSLTRAEDEPITLKKKDRRPVCRRPSVMIERGDPLFPHLCRAPKKLRDTTLKANRLGLSWSDKESRFSLIVKQRFENTNSRPITTEEAIKSWMNRSSRTKKKFVEFINETNDVDKIINLFMNSCWSKNWYLREAHKKSLSEMKELKRFQGSTFETIARRKLIEDRKTILELTGKIQELQNEIICMNDSRDFQDAESVRSGHSHVASQPVSFPPHPVPGGMLSRSFGLPSRKNGSPSIWDTHGISGNVFASPAASSSALYPQELNPWSSHMSEQIHSSQERKSENQTPVQDQRCLSGQSAKNSVIFSGGDSSKNYEADQQRLQISDLHFDEFTTPATFAFWKIRFKTEVCTCSQFPTEAMQWIIECQILKYSMRRLLQHWTESSIILTSKEESVWRNKRPSRTVSFAADRLLSWSTITSGSLGVHDSVENFADLFTIALRNNDIQEFDSKWDGILLCMTKIPSNDILEGLYKLRIRESEKLKTVLELYDLEIHQKKLGPDYHRLKTMVKRSIEQEIKNKNFGSRNGNYERNAVVKNPGTKQRVQRILGDCWQWETNGQCSRGDNCSFRYDVNKRAKMTQPNPSPNSFMQQNERYASRTRSPRGKSPSGRMSRWPCEDYLKGTCTNSFSTKWHPLECFFYKTKSGCRFGEKCSYAHRQADEQPSKKCKKNNDKSAVAMLRKYELHDRTEQPVVNHDQSHERPGRPNVKRDTYHELKRGPTGRRTSNARQLGCVFQDMKPPKSILRKSSDMQKPIQRVKFTKAIARQH